MWLLMKLEWDLRSEDKTIVLRKCYLPDFNGYSLAIGDAQLKYLEIILLIWMKGQKSYLYFTYNFSVSLRWPQNDSFDM